MINDTQEDNFKFFVPLEISKGGSGKKMSIKGIASTMDKDSDGEFLDPSGFDLDYFNTHGFFNWNHKGKNDPSMIIGEPTSAKVTKQGLYVEGTLYDNHPTAESVYKLAQALTKSGAGRKLGFSIEGKALERDSANPKIVKKAKITGIAITPTPKNSSTFLDIMKGEYYQDLNTDIKPTPIAVEAPTPDANGGDTKYLIDVTDPEGNRYTVTDNYEIKVDMKDKSLTTVSGAALMPESVEGQSKDLTRKEKKKSKYLNKSEVYQEIFDIFHTNDLEKSKLIYSFIEKVQEKLNSNMSEVTKDQISKAEEILNLVSTEDITKGSDSDFPVGKSAPAKQKETNEANGASKSDFEKACGLMKGYMKDKMDKDDMYKACQKEMGDDYSADDMNKAYKKAFDSMQEEEEGEEEEDMKEEGEEVKKGEETLSGVELKKAQLADLQAEIEDLEKAEEVEKIKSGDITDLLKSIDESNDNLQKSIDEKFQALGTLQKSNDELLEKALGEIEDLKSQLTEVASTPVGRKSVTTRQFLEKGEGLGEPLEDGASRVVSVSQNKKEALSLLDGLVDIEKGDDPFLLAAAALEAGGIVPNAKIIKQVEKETGVVLVK